MIGNKRSIYTNGQFSVVEEILSDRSKAYNIVATNGRGGQSITLSEADIEENVAVNKVDALAKVLA